MMLKRLFRPKKKPVPDHVLLLLTNPRSGSTWFFDALRCHPSIMMQPEATTFEYFGLSGRRYPRDLAAGSAGTIDIEVKSGVWETLPHFRLPETQTFAAPQPHYALEKLHPHFFNHHVDLFVQKLRQLPDARLIYQVRDPQESLISFMRYQARNPTWNPHISQAQLPAHMRRIYESMLACARAYPGMVIDYAHLEQDFVGTLQRVFAFLWGDQHPQDAALPAQIAAATSRDKRAKTSFLGQRTTDLAQDKAQYEAIFTQFADDIAACDAAYEALLHVAQEEIR